MPAQYIWLKSTWPAEELDGKSVEFRIRLKPQTDSVSSKIPPEASAFGCALLVLKHRQAFVIVYH